MSSRLVLVGAFSMPIEAQLARGRLEAEGIQAFLSGDEAVSVFSGIQGGAGQMRLHVAEADAERAIAIFATGRSLRTNDFGCANPWATWRTGATDGRR